MAEAAEVAQEGIAVSDRLGIERRKGVWCRCDAAEALTALGRYDEARQLLEDGAALVPLGVDALRTDYLTGHVLIRVGEFDAAAEHLERARDNGHHLLDDQLMGPLYQGLIEAHLWRGDLDAARKAALEAADRLPAYTDPLFGFPVFAAASPSRPSEPSPAVGTARSRCRSRGSRASRPPAPAAKW